MSSNIVEITDFFAQILNAHGAGTVIELMTIGTICFIAIHLARKSK